MNKFNLNEALKGKNVVTRLGFKVSNFFVSGNYLYGVINHCGLQSEKWNLNGSKHNGVEHHHDLFMAEVF